MGCGQKLGMRAEAAVRAKGAQQCCSDHTRPHSGNASINCSHQQTVNARNAPVLQVLVLPVHLVLQQPELLRLLKAGNCAVDLCGRVGWGQTPA